MKALEDGSYLVEGSNPDNDTYVITSGDTVVEEPAEGIGLYLDEVREFLHLPKLRK